MSSSSISDGHLNDHGQQQPQNAITAFLAKLWALVNDPTCDDLIAWDPSGGSFHVYDQSRFAREILPRYFKHNNFASFIRQLNMYGFRKMSTIEHGSLKNERDDIEFAHPSFIRGQDGLLELIKRRAPENQPKTSSVPTIKTEIPPTPLPATNNVTPNSTSDPASIRPVEIGQILTDVRNIKCKQSSLSDKLFHLEDENQALWREISLLRQKHAKQQQIVSKLMEFLLHILTSSTQSHRRSVEQPGGNASERTSTPHSTINLNSHSLKRKPAALMHGEPPNKRSSHHQSIIEGLTPPQSIIINELTDNDTSLWAPTATTMKNPSPLVDFVPSPPPSSSSTQHRDDKYSPTQTNYEWIVPGDDLINTVVSYPTGQNRSLRTVENLHDKNDTPSLFPDFFLTNTDESNGLTLHDQNHDQISLNTLDSSRTSPSKHLSTLKEEDIELVDSFPPFSSSSTNNNNNQDKLTSAETNPFTLDEFATHVDHIQSSLDNIREFMFNKIPDGTTIDDLFGEEHVLLSPMIPATSNLLTDPIHVEETKSNTDFLYPDSSTHIPSVSIQSSSNNIPKMDNRQLLAQFIQQNNLKEDQHRQGQKHLASTRK